VIQRHEFEFVRLDTGSFLLRVDPAPMWDTDDPLALSIAKWEALAAIHDDLARSGQETPVLDGAGATCALCTAYHTLDGCKGCPVAETVGRPHCEDTPYTAYHWDGPVAGRLEAIRREIDFLKSLKPTRLYKVVCRDTDGWHSARAAGQWEVRYTPGRWSSGPAPLFLFRTLSAAMDAFDSPVWEIWLADGTNVRGLPSRTLSADPSCWRAYWRMRRTPRHLFLAPPGTVVADEVRLVKRVWPPLSDGEHYVGFSRPKPWHNK